MKVTLYKTENATSFGKYWTVYLPADAAPDVLPEDIRDQLGALYPQDDIDVETDQYLSDAQKTEIRAAVAANGYYLEELPLKIRGLDQSDQAQDYDPVDIEI